jgi:hypothetical protein
MGKKYNKKANFAAMTASLVALSGRELSGKEVLIGERYPLDIARQKIAEKYGYKTWKELKHKSFPDVYDERRKEVLSIAKSSHWLPLQLKDV